MAERDIQIKILRENVSAIQFLIKHLEIFARKNSTSRYTAQGIETLAQQSEKHGRRSRWEIAAMVHGRIPID